MYSHASSNRVLPRFLAIVLIVAGLAAMASPAGAAHSFGSGGAAPDSPTLSASLVRLETEGLSPALASDLERVTDAWSAVVAGHAGCLGITPVRFENLPGLKGGYVVQEEAVVLNPNRSAATIPMVAVHELSHHLMMACDLNHDEDFRAAFNAAQGLPLDRGWFEYGAGWEVSPAEHFAEAVTVLVLGEASGRIAVADETLNLVGAWIDEPTAPLFGA